MKQRLLIAGWTIVILGAGYLAGVWTERHSCKVPPPPQQLLGELSDKNAAAAAAVKPNTPAPAPNAARLASEIAKLGPQIDAFRQRMEQIDREMDQEIIQILRPEQMKHFQSLIDKGAANRARESAEAAKATPLTAQEIAEIQQRPLYKMLGIVVVPLRLEWNTRDLKLDETQREQLRQILLHRREKFLALVDSSPPPSLTLSRIAPMAQRLVDPAKPEEKTPPQK